jgi:DNA-binding PadR family transcriptional regulator
VRHSAKRRTVYATLSKLEERSWITGRWVERAEQRRRRYYRITPAGRDVLVAPRGEWQQRFICSKTWPEFRYA